MCVCGHGTYLQSEEADAAGTLDEDGVAGLDGLEAVEGIPAGEAGAGEGGGLGVAQVLGGADDAGLVEDGVLAQGAVDDAADAGARGGDAHGAVLVALVEERDDPVAGLPPGHLGAHADDLARAVGRRHDGESRREGVFAPRDDEVAEVERGGVEPDEDLVLTRLWHLAVAEL